MTDRVWGTKVWEEGCAARAEEKVGPARVREEQCSGAGARVSRGSTLTGDEAERTAAKCINQVSGMQ